MTNNFIEKMKEKKNLKKMNETFTEEDAWKMLKLFILIIFLTMMGFLNAENRQFDKWKVLDLPYSTDDMIVLRRIEHDKQEEGYLDYWQVFQNYEPSNDNIILFKSGRSPSDMWQCPKPSCGHINYGAFLNCGLCGTYRYEGQEK